MSSPLDIARSGYHRLQDRLRQVGFRHDRWPRTFMLVDLILDPWSTPGAFDRIFERQRDPWKYATDRSERARYELAACLLDTARAGRLFGRALEIGCAEGVFTESLASRCESLVAVDFSRVALERARARCDWGETVRFAEWDLRRDQPLGEFDLVVVMDVLTLFLRPKALRRACGKLAASVRPEGYLLVGNYRENPVFERSWWGRSFLRGGKWVTAAVADHSELGVVAQASTDTHVLALLRKGATEAPPSDRSRPAAGGSNPISRFS